MSTGRKIKKNTPLYQLLDTQQFVVSRNIKTHQAFRDLSANQLRRPFTQQQPRNDRQNKIEQAVPHDQRKKQKFRLKTILGKIKLIIQGKHIDDDPVELACQVLQILAKTSNFYTETFHFINSQIVNKTFFSKQKEIMKEIKKYCEFKDNQLFLKMINPKIKQRISYYRVCWQLFSQLNGLVRFHKEQKSKSENHIQQLNKIVQRKISMIYTLKKQLQYYMIDPNQSIMPYLEQLQVKVKQNQKKIGQLNSKNKQYKDQVQMLKKTNTRLSDKIYTLKKDIYQLELENNLRTQKIQNNDSLQKFENQAKNLKEMLDKSIVRLLAMKDQFQKVKQINFSLVSQRAQLARRAAVGFTQLTPRPNYKQILSQQGISQSIFKGHKKKFNTNSFFKILIERLHQLNFKNKQSFVQKQLSSSIRRMHQKTIQQIDAHKIKIENDPQKILKEVLKGKQRVNELIKKKKQIHDGIKQENIKNSDYES